MGVRRLDELLGGGLRPRSAFLVIGPAFSGKRVLQQKALGHVVDSGHPGVVVTTRGPARHFSDGRLVQGPQTGGARIRFVDSYSRRVGFHSSPPHTRLVDPVDLGAMVHAINGALAEADPDPQQDRLLMVDSLTSLVAHNGMDDVYAFLEMLVGCAKAFQAAVHLTVDREAHSDQELALLRFLADNVLELRMEDGNRVLHLSGVDVHEDLPWIEYKYDNDRFDPVGSFTATRIR